MAVLSDSKLGVRQQQAHATSQKKVGSIINQVAVAVAVRFTLSHLIILASEFVRERKNDLLSVPTFTLIDCNAIPTAALWTVVPYTFHHHSLKRIVSYW